jgi:hypothetical protein
MFIQTIQGHVSDADELKAGLDKWARELAPRAIGWLGTTSGVTADGTFIALVRFDSAESARRNSDRPEQHQWWMETAKLFSGEVIFRDSREVELMAGGGSDQAGFVQVIQGKVSDEARVRDLDRRMLPRLSELRPDVLGGVNAYHGDGAFTTAVYFTSEQAAREGERKEPPPDVKALLDEEQSLYVEGPVFFDLPRPWLYLREGS